MQRVFCAGVIQHTLLVSRPWYTMCSDGCSPGPPPLLSPVPPTSPSAADGSTGGAHNRGVSQSQEGREHILDTRANRKRGGSIIYPARGCGGGSWTCPCGERA
eukprot:1407029-Pyramimonas_sp.AAC.1